MDILYTLSNGFRDRSTRVPWQTGGLWTELQRKQWIPWSARPLTLIYVHSLRVHSNTPSMAGLPIPHRCGISLDSSSESSARSKSDERACEDVMPELFCCFNLRRTLWCDLLWYIVFSKKTRVFLPFVFLLTNSISGYLFFGFFSARALFSPRWRVTRKL